ncbi:MAG: SMC-Scp complex subunit ScpB [Clostridia bacterium]|nr:SMC-Scp complex subunit ScpB [Clostridia bacterium]
MERENLKGIVEAILFSVGREVKVTELMGALEKSPDEIVELIEEMKQQYKSQSRGIEIIKVKDAYQLSTKRELYENIYPIIDKRAKPNLSGAALETLAIIAYNPRITRPEIEAIRGVNCDGTMYKLLEYNLIECLGKSDIPGKPSMYGVTTEFFRMFGFSSLEELPDLPKYKIDENEQIIIEEMK